MSLKTLTILMNPRKTLSHFLLKCRENVGAGDKIFDELESKPRRKQPAPQYCFLVTYQPVHFGPKMVFIQLQ
jgi:hypothetical protein